MTTLIESKSSQPRSIIATPSLIESDNEIKAPILTQPQTPLAKQTKRRTTKQASAQALSTANLIIETPQKEGELDEENFFHEIDRLQAYGINAADIMKLKNGGYCTVLSIIQATKKELCQIKGISEAKVEKVLEAAAKIEVANSFMTGNQMMKRRAQVLKVTTGSSQLDKLLNGGIESMSITEIFGENRTGKTQICHTLCVTSQLPLEMGGGNGKVCFIDTEGTFRPEKIHKVRNWTHQSMEQVQLVLFQISERYGLTGEAILENIIYARAFTHEHLNQLISMAAGKMVEDHFSLLVIDSIMALFRVDFSGRGELSERQQVLGKTLSKLIKVAEQFNIAVLYTNHVMSDPSGGLTFVANPSKPIGGHVLGHASTTRLSLRKGKGEQRICKVYDSPYLPESECVFQLSGILDKYRIYLSDGILSDGGIIDATD